MPFELRSLIENAVTMVRHVKQPGVSLRVETPANVPRLVGSPFHLQQILDCVGIEPLRLPFVDPQRLLGPGTDLPALSQTLADHLSHDIRELGIQVVPEPLEKCGGGG